MSDDLSITASRPFGWNVGEPVPRIHEPVKGFGWHINAAGQLMVDGKPAADPPHPVTMDGLQAWVDMVRSARSNLWRQKLRRWEQA
jgi:hypothetical protein